MPKRKDITGQRFGKLVAGKFVGADKKQRALWLCRCDCGNEKVIQYGALQSKGTISCGCYRLEAFKQRATKHGKTNTRLFRIWDKMIERCEKPNSKHYKGYGSRGISVCKEWHEFITFYDWAMANGYSDKLSIDRINNDGNYEPSNCRWATNIQQSNNKRNNHYYIINGEKLTAPQIARKYNLNVATIKTRLNRGLTIDEAILPLKVIHKPHKKRTK